MEKHFFYVIILIVLKCYMCKVEGDKLNNNRNESFALQDDCTCVPFYQCRDMEALLDASDYMIPRATPQDDYSTSEDCGEVNEVCCRHPSNMTNQHKCGKRNPDGILEMMITGRVMTADVPGEVRFGEWPWQAELNEVYGDNFVYKCGAVLIDERHALTVAHCARKFLKPHLKAVIRLGVGHVQHNFEILLYENYNVSEIILHPNFRPNNIFNDIAILKLNGNVSFKPHINTVCLPKPVDDFDGQICTVTGWGDNNYTGGSFSSVLKEVNLPIIPNIQCQDMLRRTRLGYRFRLHDSFMCAGGKKGEDACTGDGGGPLVCLNSDKTYTLAGLVSWGVGCGNEGIPGVYVNVKKFTDWIASITGQNISKYWSTQ